MSKIYFSEQTKSKIKETIGEVEKNTSGEILIQIVKKSDNYQEAPFIASLIVLGLLLIILIIMSELWILPFNFNIQTYSVLLIAINLITFLLFATIPRLKILVIPENKEKKMVHKNAIEAFLNNEIFQTKERTGILIFISELEKNVEILADSGINQRVKPEDWVQIVNELTNGIKSKNIENSILKAIQDCGNLLSKAGFAPSQDNTNELPNDLILK